MDSEEEWISYHDEETEVLIELSDIIFDKLIEETVDSMNRIRKIRSRPNYFS